MSSLPELYQMFTLLIGTLTFGEYYLIGVVYSLADKTRKRSQVIPGDGQGIFGRGMRVLFEDNGFVIGARPLFPLSQRRL